MISSHTSHTVNASQYNKYSDMKSYNQALILIIHSIVQVSFSDFGPEWAQIIVTPKNYSANYCAGHCRFPVTIKDNVTKHSYLQSLANLRDPDVVPEPCCVPIGLVHTYVIVKDTEISGDSYIDSYVVDSWRDTRALACGCR